MPDHEKCGEEDDAENKRLVQNEIGRCSGPPTVAGLPHAFTVDLRARRVKVHGGIMCAAPAIVGDSPKETPR